MDLLLISVIAVIALALIFDFTNGFHDAANSVATVVATRALPAKWAPAFSAFFNFVAYFVVGTAVANTLAHFGRIDVLVSDDELAAGLLAAEHLVSLGHRHIGYVTGVATSSLRPCVKRWR